MKRGLFIVFLVVFNTGVFAQYTVNGDASQVSCNEYILTTNAGAKHGSVWNNTKIDLTQSFTFNFDIFLGNSNSPGADGIAFVLQPISTSVGGAGGGLGYEGITPAVGVTIDTYQNPPNGDPVYDHIAIQLNGDMNHSGANSIAAPVTALSGNDNIEDGSWHTMLVQWNPFLKRMQVSIDGVLRVSAVKDFVTDVFGGNPLVYWGFTGSTGGEFNLQKFRTALSPSFNFLPGQKRCLNEPIQFINNTVSFAPITSFSWDFGDGSPFDNVNSNPIHTYTTAGDFTVRQMVTGADGCSAINIQNVRIGSKPIADFRISDSCVSNTIQFTDISTATFGTINNWYWDFDNSTTSTQQNPFTTYSTNGYKNIRLAVKSLEGCESDTLIQAIRIYSRPIVDFTFTDSVCLGSPTLFNGSITPVGGDVATSWNFIIDGQSFPNQLSPSYTFTTPGNQTVTFVATATNAGCLALAVKNVFVRSKPIAWFKNTPVCQSQNNTLTDSSYNLDGSSITGWWWDLGNGQFSTLQNPPILYPASGSKIIKLVVRSGNCFSDTLVKTITVESKPIAKFGHSNNLCEGVAINFTDSSSVVGGTVTQWEWLQNGAFFSSAQNSLLAFGAGPHTIQLIATSNSGCVSDTSTQVIVVEPKPDISMAFNNACRNNPVNFTATVNNGLAVTNWSWSFGDGSFGITNPAQHTYTVNGTYPVSLVATSNAGCMSSPVSRNIIIYSTKAFAGNDTIAAAGQPIQLNASGGINYEWMPTTGLSNPFIANPITTLTQTQQYILKAFTPQGCISYDTVLIKIYNGPDIYLPNAFTPNGDGMNDIFKGIPVGIKEFKYLKIYNRWGEEIFATTNYRIGWNGEWKGQKQEQGTYIVMAYGIDFKGNIISKKGTVMLLR